jgi:hypothetical protein
VDQAYNFDMTTLSPVMSHFQDYEHQQTSSLSFKIYVICASTRRASQASTTSFMLLRSTSQEQLRAFIRHAQCQDTTKLHASMPMLSILFHNTFRGAEMTKKDSGRPGAAQVSTSKNESSSSSL